MGDDLSVTDRVHQPTPAFAALRQARAQARSATIRGAAADLVSTDASVAGQISGAASGLNGTQFEDGVPSSPDDQVVNGRKRGDPHIQMVDDTTGPTSPPTPTPGAQPQIGPFPVPTQVAAAAPPGPPRPIDPTGGLLLPENLPPAQPPPNIPGVKVAPPPAAPPGAPPLPSYPDLVKQVQQQGQQLADQAKAATRPTPGGIAGAMIGGCASTGLTAGIVGAETGPIDGPIAAGGCVVGALGSLGGYLSGIWANNSIGGAG